MSAASNSCGQQRHAKRSQRFRCLGRTARAQQSVQPGEFTRNALLHNLRDTDYGCPISEIRDAFWSNPHKPLLPTGVAELREAIFAAISEGDIKLVGPDGVVYLVHSPNDINLAASGIRIRRVVHDESLSDDEGTRDPSDSSTATQVVPPYDPEDAASTDRSTQQSNEVDSQPDSPNARVRHWQLTLNINKAVNPDDPDDGLVNLLRELSNRLEEGKIAHITQTTQITVTGEQSDADALEDLAKEAGTAVNVIKV